MKSLEKSWRLGSAAGVLWGAPQAMGTGLSTGFGLRVARYRSASDSPKLIASVSGLSPSRDSDSVMLARAGLRNLESSDSGAR